MTHDQKTPNNNKRINEQTTNWSNKTTLNKEGDFVFQIFQQRVPYVKLYECQSTVVSPKPSREKTEKETSMGP